MGQSKPQSSLDLEQAAFKQLLGVLDTLLGPKGCDWDKKQTPKTLFPYVLEELWETYETLSRPQTQKATQEELGDLLYTVLFLIKVYSNSQNQSFEAILSPITQKMIRRHPHVFSDDPPPLPEEALAKWQQIKAAEGKTETADSKQYRKTLVAVFAFLNQSPTNRKKLDNFLDTFSP